MYWKMSIDLSRPLVTSEGNLDPYDGYVTYRIVDDAASGTFRSFFYIYENIVISSVHHIRWFMIIICIFCFNSVYFVNI